MSKGRHVKRRTVTLSAVAVAALVAGGLTLVLTPSANAATPAADHVRHDVHRHRTGTAANAWTPAPPPRANGTAVQQYTCNGTAAQQWMFTATERRLLPGRRRAPHPRRCGTTRTSRRNDSSPIQLWLYGGGTNQQWLPVAESTGTFHFVNRFSGKCLDVPGRLDRRQRAAAAVRVQRHRARSRSRRTQIGGGGGTTPPTNPNNPDLGPNVKIFDPSMSAASIQSQLDTIDNAQQSNQFGQQRYALLFKPGTYNASVNVGYYTQVAGLGLSPNDVVINGGGVNANAQWFGGNATQNFWRSVENLTDHPSSGTVEYAVSQASPMRRVHIQGNMILDDNGGWSSGGFLGDSVVDGQVNSGSQQQWLSRNDSFGSWTGSNWNMVFVGDTHAPAQSFPSPPDTTVASTPSIAEKPFLYVDSTGAYQVFVPALRTNSSATSWASGTAAGTSLPISQFYIAKPADTAATINAALAAGQEPAVHAGCLPPDEHDQRHPGRHRRAGPRPRDAGSRQRRDRDVGRRRRRRQDRRHPVRRRHHQLADPAAGRARPDRRRTTRPTRPISPTSSPGSAAPPSARQRSACRSTATTSSVTTCGCGEPTTRTASAGPSNTAQNGLVVNGNNVIMYGLAAEHYQQYSVLWNGNGGRTYFYQNEFPYDVPNQASWMNGSTRGYASYKVANTVTTHEAWGVGVYCFFSTNSAVVADHAFEVPQVAGVKFHDLVTVSLGGTGTIAPHHQQHRCRRELGQHRRRSDLVPVRIAAHGPGRGDELRPGHVVRH